MVTDEVKMRNDTARSSYLLAPTQEKEVVVCCSEESPKEERVGTMGQQQGHDEALKFTVTSMEMEINLQGLRSFFKMSARVDGGER